MALSQQQLLKKSWLEAPRGNLNALSEAKAWALREVWRHDGKSDWGLQTFVAGRVKKVGGGSPNQAAISKFFAKVDADADWFPGKSYQKTHGPEPALSAQARNAIAHSAMSMKLRDEEPTFGKIVGACPNAILNPATKKPVDKKRVYDVMRAHCYDEDQDDPWTCRPRLSKTALTEDMEQKRWDWAVAVQALRHTPKWYYERLVWTDLCNSILPRSEKKAAEQALARKGGKGWGSSGTKMYSRNLRGKREALKQKSWDTEKVWWAPFLARGKLHVEVFDQGFPGEVPKGAALLVAKARAALNIRFQGSEPPTVVYVDRGKGFYDPGTGRITAEFEEALQESGLKAFWGEDASAQPGQLQEIHLHETAVSWLRHRLTTSTPASAAKETREEYTARLKACCADINATCDVDALSRSFPKRVQLVVDAEGGRIRP